VVNWLQSSFSACIPRQRRSSRWATSTYPSTPNLRPSSSCPSMEAIIADTGHRLEVNAITYCQKRESKGDMKYRTPTTNMPTFVHTASAQMLTQAPRS
jgi:hypothetical protein